MYGYYVFEAVQQDIVEIFEIRLMMDKMMVTKLITEVLPGNYHYYRESLQQIEENFNAGIAQGSKLFIKYDEDFHDSLIKLLNNSDLVKQAAINV